MLSNRRTWDETWFLVAYIVGMRSRCVRDQVGAVITDAENRIVATGYNGPPANLAGVHEYDRCDRFCDRAKTGETPDSYANCVSNHAEINALSFADRRAMEGGTFYVSSAICFTCAKAVANSGVKRVVVPGSSDNPHRNPSRSYNFLHRECGIQVVMMP